MATLDILTALVKGGMTPVGACAMGGNMMAESSMRSNNLQDSFQKKLGFNDEEYTRAVDNGTYRFAQDGVGYGLCQWTYHTRKADLLDFAKSIGKSVGDEGMQVEFCLLEMKTDYPETWRFLQIEKDLRCCTSWICEEYERPAVNNIETRYKYAQQMYKEYGAILEKIADHPEKFYVDAGGELREYGKWYDHGDPTGEPGHCGLEADCKGRLMATVKTGEHTPEAVFLAEKLKMLGYDVLWDGLTACLKDFQQKKGLDVDGICGEKTWKELLR